MTKRILQNNQRLFQFININLTKQIHKKKVFSIKDTLQFAFKLIIDIQIIISLILKNIVRMKMFDSLKQNLSNVFGKKQQQKHIEPHIPKQFSYEILQNGNAKIVLHRQYEINKDDPLFQDLSAHVLLAKQKKSDHKCKIREKFNLQYYPSFQFALAKAKMEQQKCTICLCEFQIKKGQELEDELFKDNDQDIYMLKCTHMFHLGCLKNLIGAKDWAKCPVCSTIFGIMKGDQPEGRMDVSYDKHTDIPGYGKGAITIQYRMKSGTRNGIGYAGTTRTAYLPNNKQGNQAFNRGLIFTVGRSVTTGLDNQTVWNGIHHKTSITGGVGSFGYPDGTYLNRVKEELAVKGITLEIKKK